MQLSKFFSFVDFLGWLTFLALFSPDGLTLEPPVLFFLV